LGAAPPKGIEGTGGDRPSVPHLRQVSVFHWLFRIVPIKRDRRRAAFSPPLPSQVFVFIRFPDKGDQSDQGDRDYRAALRSFIERASGCRKADRSDRRGQRPGPVFGGAKSLFPYCFPGKVDRSDRLDRDYRRMQCPDRSIVHLSHEPHGSAATRDAAADRGPSASQSLQCQRTDRTIAAGRNPRSRLRYHESPPTGSVHFAVTGTDPT